MKSFTIHILQTQEKAFRDACAQRHFICKEIGRKNGVASNINFEVTNRNPNGNISVDSVFWLGSQFSINDMQAQENEGN
jgi:hypothetical protein